MADLERVRVWAEALIRMHLDGTWSFGFDNAKRRAGVCSHTHRRITVSRYISALNDDDEVHQTLLHEVAHAMAGAGAGHGPEWKRIAREIGYVGGTTHNGRTPTELAPWVGTCPNGHALHRYRRPPRVSSCTKCAPRFDPRFVIAWRHREVPTTVRRRARAAAG
ncbi:SprT-like domain-containing protein [Microbacterium halophytorum]|uniref:SprT-like domain-containing protein n=1 Tax=Microbacterium halophytorum TaxID=2067568 RepID=UPI000CFB2CEA|nr:SprT-like domain-containing protein [Microbacterium halophytorum]